MQTARKTICHQRGSAAVEWFIWIVVIGAGLAFGGGTVACTLALVAIFIVAGSGSLLQRSVTR